MNCYVPTVATHWGDWICGLFASELLSKLDPSIVQVIDPTYYEKPDRSKPSSLLDWVQLPWAGGFDRVDVVEASKRFDKIITTHHRHCHKKSMYDGVPSDKMLFFDAHGLSFRCVVDGWYPTFNPTQRLMEAFARLQLIPGEYSVVHLNEPLNDCRRTRSVSEFIAMNQRGLHDLARDVQLVSTSCNVPGSLDLSSLHGWLKMIVLINAKEVWASHSGFTSIASMYRRRKDVKLVNEYGNGILNMGPPPICYSNYDVQFEGLRRELAWTVMQGWFPESHGDEYREWSERSWKDWNSFAMFTGDQYDLEVPELFQEPRLHLDSENCLVPWEARFKMADGNVLDYVNDLETITSVSRKVLDPELFRRYH